MKKIAVAFSYPLCARNFIHSGLLNMLVKKGFQIKILSPYKKDAFEDAWGNIFSNTYIPVRSWDKWGAPLIEGTGMFYKFLVSLRTRGYAIEYPDGSLQTMEVSKPNSIVWLLSWLLVKLFPRKSRGRKWLRTIYDSIGPRNGAMADFFKLEKPDLLITATMGHLSLDFICLTMAKKFNIKKMCVLLSWDNLYSRGAVFKHPDKLLVWSKIMKKQALEIHQFSSDEVKVVGPLQFVSYAEPLSSAELNSAREKFSLTENDKYIFYVCGGRTPQYDIEDILVLLKILRDSEFKDHKVIVRPHPQVKAEHYDQIKNLVYVDYSPSLLNANDPEKIFERSAVRHLASLLVQADYVVSSWGTTALLEACVFDKKVVQLNWYDSVDHQDQTQREMVKLFQRYYHMKEFDDYEGRVFSYQPTDLIGKFRELAAKNDFFASNRKRIKEDFTNGEYGKVTSAITREIELICEVKDVSGSAWQAKNFVEINS